MIWSGHIERVGEMGNTFGKPEENDHWEVLGVDGRIRLEWIIE
jgi:hypothetical protein